MTSPCITSLLRGLLPCTAPVRWIPPLPYTDEYIAYWTQAVDLSMGLGDVLAIRTAAEQHVKRVEEDAKALRIALDDDSVYGLAVEERDRASAAVEAAGAAIEAMINSTITAVVAIRRREQAEAAANRRAEIVALEAAGMDANPDGLRQAGTLADRATMAALMVEEVAISNNAEAAHLEALGA